MTIVSVTSAKTYAADLGERVVWTFLQAFAAQLIASGWFSVAGVVDLSILEKAAIAGAAAVLAVIKGLVAAKVGDPNNASLVPVESA